MQLCAACVREGARAATLCERYARYNNHIDLGCVRQSVADAESVKLSGV